MPTLSDAGDGGEVERPPDGMAVPGQLEIKLSHVTDRLGIWSKEEIKEGSKFGPFEGEKTVEATPNMDPRFIWQVVDLESKEHLWYVDATDPQKGNWMRYINCARFYEEQNIMSEQEGTDIYYKALKDIAPGEELLTWYEKVNIKKGKKRLSSTTTGSKSTNPSPSQPQPSTSTSPSSNPKDVTTESPTKEPLVSKVSPSKVSSKEPSVTKVSPTKASSKEPLVSKVSPAKASSKEPSVTKVSPSKASSKEPSVRKVSPSPKPGKGEGARGGAAPTGKVMEAGGSLKGKDGGVQEEGSGEGRTRKRAVRKPIRSRSSSFEMELSGESGDEPDQGQLPDSDTEYMPSKASRKQATATSRVSSRKSNPRQDPDFVDHEEMFDEAAEADDNESLYSTSSNQLDLVEAGFYHFEIQPHHVVKGRMGRKNFKCDICSAIYRHAFSLKRHYVRTHINYKFVSKADMVNCNISADMVGGENGDVEMVDNKGEESPDKSARKISDVPSQGEEVVKGKVGSGKETVSSAPGGSSELLSLLEAPTGPTKKESSVKGDQKDTKQSPTSDKVDISDSDKIKEQEKDSSSKSQVESSTSLNLPNEAKVKESPKTELCDTPEKSSDKDSPSTKGKDSSLTISTSQEPSKAASPLFSSSTSPGSGLGSLFGKKKGGKGLGSLELICSKLKSKQHMQEADPVCVKSLSNLFSKSQSDSDTASISSTGVKSVDSNKEISSKAADLIERKAVENSMEFSADKKEKSDTSLVAGSSKLEGDVTSKNVIENEPSDSSKSESKELDSQDKKSTPSKDTESAAAKTTENSAEKPTESVSKSTPSKTDTVTDTTAKSEGSTVPSGSILANILLKPPDKPPALAETSPESGKRLSGSRVRMPGLYRCNLCGQIFDTVNDLKHHIQNHPDELASGSNKLHACELCDMKFTHRQNLMRHLAVHTGEKVYVCRFCGKKFPTLTNQKRHERIHEGKRFKCSHCQRSFSQTGDLKKHIRKLHPQHFNECAFCGKYFSKKGELDSHVEGHGENAMTNRRELNRRTETAKVDQESDRAESMRIAAARPSELGFHFACTICRKRFHDYANMCRHRRLAHHRMLLSNLPRNRQEVGEVTTPKSSAVMEADPFYSFYVNVAKNIEDNLTSCLDGTQERIDKSAEIFIKWMKGDSDKHDSSRDNKDTPKKSQVQLTKYNFPQGFKLRPPQQLVKPIEKVEFSPQFLKAESSSPEGEKEDSGRPYRTRNRLRHPNTASFKKGEDRKDKKGSPAGKVRESPAKETSPSKTPPTNPIRIPEIRKCVRCRAVFHHADMYTDHMIRLHHVSPEEAERESREKAHSPKTKSTDLNIPISIQCEGKDQQAAMDLSLSPPVRSPTPGGGQRSPHLNREEARVLGLKTKKLGPKEPLVLNPVKEGEYPTTSDPMDKLKKFVCTACFQEFMDRDLLEQHQEKEHPAIEFNFKQIEVEATFAVPWRQPPSTVGLLNVSSSQLPSQDTTKKYTCTKCSLHFPTMDDLHAHIVRDCSDYERNPPKYIYVWVSRSKSQKLGQSKVEKFNKKRYQRKVDTPVKDSTSSHRRGESEDEDSRGAKRRRRRDKPGPEVRSRKRELMEFFETCSCEGCGEVFRTITQLERHIPLCSHKDKIAKEGSGNSNGGDSQEQEDDPDAYDPNKHLCIYCLKQFTYLGMLRKHIFEVCAVRREFVEQDEYLDEEWEADLVNRTGGSKPTARQDKVKNMQKEEGLSRQSSTTSLLALLDEQADSDTADADGKKKKRKRRGHGWGKSKDKDRNPKTPRKDDASTESRSQLASNENSMDSLISGDSSSTASDLTKNTTDVKPSEQSFFAQLKASEQKSNAKREKDAKKALALDKKEASPLPPPSSAEKPVVTKSGRTVSPTRKSISSQQSISPTRKSSSSRTVSPSTKIISPGKDTTDGKASAKAKPGPKTPAKEKGQGRGKKITPPKQDKVPKVGKGQVDKKLDKTPKKRKNSPNKMPKTGDMDKEYEVKDEMMKSQTDVGQNKIKGAVNKKTVDKLKGKLQKKKIAEAISSDKSQEVTSKKDTTMLAKPGSTDTSKGSGKPAGKVGKAAKVMRTRAGTAAVKAKRAAQQAARRVAKKSQEVSIDSVATAIESVAITEQVVNKIDSGVTSSLPNNPSGSSADQGSNTTTEYTVTANPWKETVPSNETITPVATSPSSSLQDSAKDVLHNETPVGTAECVKDMNVPSTEVKSETNVDTKSEPKSMDIDIAKSSKDVPVSTVDTLILSKKEKWKVNKHQKKEAAKAAKAAKKAAKALKLQKEDTARNQEQNEQSCSEPKSCSGSGCDEKDTPKDCNDTAEIKSSQCGQTDVIKPTESAIELPPTEVEKDKVPMNETNAQESSESDQSKESKQKKKSRKKKSILQIAEAIQASVVGAKCETNPSDSKLTEHIEDSDKPSLEKKPDQGDTELETSIQNKTSDVSFEIPPISSEKETCHITSEEKLKDEAVTSISLDSQKEFVRQTVDQIHSMPSKSKKGKKSKAKQDDPEKSECVKPSPSTKISPDLNCVEKDNGLEATTTTEAIEDKPIPPTVSSKCENLSTVGKVKESIKKVLIKKMKKSKKELKKNEESITKLDPIESAPQLNSEAIDQHVNSLPVDVDDLRTKATTPQERTKTREQLNLTPWDTDLQTDLLAMEELANMDFGLTAAERIKQRGKRKSVEASTEVSKLTITEPMGGKSVPENPTKKGKKKKKGKSDVVEVNETDDQGQPIKVVIKQKLLKKKKNRQALNEELVCDEPAKKKKKKSKDISSDGTCSSEGVQQTEETIPADASTIDSMYPIQNEESQEQKDTLTEQDNSPSLTEEKLTDDVAAGEPEGSKTGRRQIPARIASSVVPALIAVQRNRSPGRKKAPDVTKDNTTDLSNKDSLPEATDVSKVKSKSDMNKMSATEETINDSTSAVLDSHQSRSPIKRALKNLQSPKVILKRSSSESPVKVSELKSDIREKNAQIPYSSMTTDSTDDEDDEVTLNFKTPTKPIQTADRLNKSSNNSLPQLSPGASPERSVNNEIPGKDYSKLDISTQSLPELSPKVTPGFKAKGKKGRKKTEQPDTSTPISVPHSTPVKLTQGPDVKESPEMPILTKMVNTPKSVHNSKAKMLQNNFEDCYTPAETTDSHLESEKSIIEDDVKPKKKGRKSKKKLNDEVSFETSDKDKDTGNEHSTKEKSKKGKKNKKKRGNGWSAVATHNDYDDTSGFDAKTDKLSTPISDSKVKTSEKKSKSKVEISGPLSHDPLLDDDLSSLDSFELESSALDIDNTMGKTSASSSFVDFVDDEMPSINSPKKRPKKGRAGKASDLESEVESMKDDGKVSEVDSQSDISFSLSSFTRTDQLSSKTSKNQSHKGKKRKSDETDISSETTNTDPEKIKGIQYANEQVSQTKPYRKATEANSNVYDFEDNAPDTSSWLDKHSSFNHSNSFDLPHPSIDKQPKHKKLKTKWLMEEQAAKAALERANIHIDIPPAAEEAKTTKTLKKGIKVTRKVKSKNVVSTKHSKKSKKRNSVLDTNSKVPNDSLLEDSGIENEMMPSVTSTELDIDAEETSVEQTPDSSLLKTKTNKKSKRGRKPKHEKSDHSSSTSINDKPLAKGIPYDVLESDNETSVGAVEKKSVQESSHCFLETTDDDTIIDDVEEHPPQIDSQDKTNDKANTDITDKSISMNEVHENEQTAPKVDIDEPPSPKKRGRKKWKKALIQAAMEDEAAEREAAEKEEKEREAQQKNMNDEIAHRFEKPEEPQKELYIDTGVNDDASSFGEVESVESGKAPAKKRGRRKKSIESEGSVEIQLQSPQRAARTAKTMAKITMSFSEEDYLQELLLESAAEKKKAKVTSGIHQGMTGRGAGRVGRGRGGRRMHKISLTEVENIDSKQHSDSKTGDDFYQFTDEEEQQVEDSGRNSYLSPKSREKNVSVKTQMDKPVDIPGNAYTYVGELSTEESQSHIGNIPAMPSQGRVRTLAERALPRMGDPLGQPGLDVYRPVIQARAPSPLKSMPIITGRMRGGKHKTKLDRRLHAKVKGLKKRGRKPKVKTDDSGKQVLNEDEPMKPKTDYPGSSPVAQVPDAVETAEPTDSVKEDPFNSEEQKPSPKGRKRRRNAAAVCDLLNKSADNVESESDTYSDYVVAPPKSSSKKSKLPKSVTDIKAFSDMNEDSLSSYELIIETESPSKVGAAMEYEEEKEQEHSTSQDAREDVEFNELDVVVQTSPRHKLPGDKAPRQSAKGGAGKGKGKRGGNEKGDADKKSSGRKKKTNDSQATDTNHSNKKDQNQDSSNKDVSGESLEGHQGQRYHPNEDLSPEKDTNSEKDIPDKKDKRVDSPKPSNDKEDAVEESPVQTNEVFSLAAYLPKAVKKQIPNLPSRGFSSLSRQTSVSRPSTSATSPHAESPSPGKKPTKRKLTDDLGYSSPTQPSPSSSMSPAFSPPPMSPNSWEDQGLMHRSAPVSPASARPSPMSSSKPSPSAMSPGMSSPSRPSPRAVSPAAMSKPSPSALSPGSSQGTVPPSPGSGGRQVRQKKKRRSEVEEMLEAAFSMHEVRKAEKELAQQQQLIAEGAVEPETSKSQKRRSLFETYYDKPKRGAGDGEGSSPVARKEEEGKRTKSPKGRDSK